MLFRSQVRLLGHPAKIGKHSLLISTTVVAVASTLLAVVPAHSVNADVGMQRRLLDKILHGIPELRIERVRLGAPPSRYHGSRRATWLYYEIRASGRARYIQSLWQSAIISGLLRDQSATRGLRPVAGQTIHIIRRDGSLKLDSETVITRPFRGETLGAARQELSKLIRAGARNAHTEVQRLRFVSALGFLAPDVMLTTARPGAFLQKHNANVDELIRPITIANGRPLADGIFVEVRTEKGRWVSSDGVAVRAGYEISAASTAFP